MSGLKCSEKKPHPVYQVINNDHKLYGTFDNTQGPYYIVTRTDPDPKTVSRTPIQREVKGAQVTQFLQGLNMGVSAPAEGSGVVSTLPADMLTSRFNITHIRFIGCTNWNVFWIPDQRPDSATLPKAFHALLERK